jgi:hypothetical protein
MKALRKFLGISLRQTWVFHAFSLNKQSAEGA